MGAPEKIYQADQLATGFAPINAPNAAEAPEAARALGVWRARLLQPRIGGLLSVALVLALLPLVLPNSYYYDVAIRIGINAMVAVGLNLLIGYAGQISLGHAGFFGVGAYASAILTSQYGWPPVIAMWTSMLAVGLLAFLIARPIFRLKGHYLAMATLGLGIIISIVITTEGKYTGGPDGMSVPPFDVLGWVVSGEKAWYAVTGLLLLATLWLTLNFVDSPVGRALRALHGSEVAAQVVGIDTSAYKVKVFVLSAAFASGAGSLAAHYVGFVTPGVASFFHSIELVTMVVVGGMASTFGALVGATILTLLPQVLSRFEGYEMVVFGAILMLTMIFVPKGLVPTIMRRCAGHRPAPGRGEPTTATLPAIGTLAPTTSVRHDGVLLEVSGLGKAFGGVHAVQDVSFAVRPGSIHAVIGPNGAGKTTLFNLITGVYTPSAGTIRLAGADVGGLGPHQLAARGMSRTFQNLQICMNMSAVENVMVGAHLRLDQNLGRALLRLPGGVRNDLACRGEAEALMAFCGVGQYVGYAADQMPYGALKRLEIARALAARPSILLLDEPAAGLNHTETEEISALIRKIADAGITVVLVEHDMKLVMGLSHHILVLNYGKKLAEGTPDEIRRNPEVIAAYLGGA
jgi:branched-chain amino acid transport system permease protein